MLSMVCGKSITFQQISFSKEREKNIWQRMQLGRVSERLTPRIRDEKRRLPPSGPAREIYQV